MKSRSLIIILILSLLAPVVPLPNAEAANDVYLDDYYYAHAPAGVAGTFPFKTKNGATTITFPEATQGINVFKYSNNKNYTIRCQVGGAWKTVTVATGHLKASPKQSTYRCELETNGEVEAYGAVRWAGDVLHMENRYYLGGTPSQPGDGSDGNTGRPGTDPGDGGDGGKPGKPGGGGETGGDGGNGGKPDVMKNEYHAYYVPHRDEYRMDYDYPMRATSYKLFFTSSAGKKYQREYSGQPTGIHYLTCNNGTYYIEFYDSMGNVVGRTDPPFRTSQIKNGTCSSYGEQTGVNDLNARHDGSAIIWDDNGAEHYEVWKDGVKMDVVYEARYETTDPGSYMILAVSEGRYTGQSDLVLNRDEPNNPDPPGPGGGGTCGTLCDQMLELLMCPFFEDYMGEWENMLNRVIPPPPNWDYVAGVMRDTIVPAMGDEIVRRTPEMARIIADEFQRREKPVAPPPPTPAPFKPSVPRPMDSTGNMSFDLNDNVPSFEPDYSGSQGFTIPDPMDIEYDNTDRGYDHQKPESDAPAYQMQDTELEKDIGYEVKTDVTTTPEYQQKNDDANTPDKEYQYPESKPDPGYQTGDNEMPHQDYEHPPDAPVPEYRRR